MKWIEPTIESIYTSELIFFSNKHKDVCEKICKALNIDLFPDIDYKSCHTLVNGKWSKKVIPKQQKVEINTSAFYKTVIDKLSKKNSNKILFCFDNDILTGIVHFSDYNSKHIYNSLYQNFYSFETKLREYLTILGFDYSDFEKYFEFQLAKRNKKSDIDYYTKRLIEIQSEKYKSDAKNLQPLQKLYLYDLLRFSTSSFHKKFEIGFNNVDVYAICKLRNTIMHSTDFISHKEESIFDFLTFETFFKNVDIFKNTFNQLKTLYYKKISDEKIFKNQLKLNQIKDFNENDIRKFYII